MGNYKFRLSDMMPNAWFYKLRDMSITRNSHPPAKKKPPSSSNTKSLSQKSPYFNQSGQSYYYSSDFSARSGEFYNPNTIPKGSNHHLPFFPDPPRRSSKHRRTRRKTVYKPSPKRIPASFVPDNDHCSSCHASISMARDLFDSSTDVSVDLDFLKSPLSEFESGTFDANESINGGQAASYRSSSCSCGFSSSGTDIIIDVDAKSYTRKIEKLDGFDTLLDLDLPPILTKPAKFDDALQEAAAKFGSPTKKTKLVEKKSEAAAAVSIKFVKEVNSVKTQKEATQNSPGTTRKSVSYSSGIKLRANSPRLAATSKRIQSSGGRKSTSRRTAKSSQKKGFSESFAIVKASLDPEKDFRESMMEMIVENNIRASKDLEELLACYLSLNSDEYHGLIIKAFEQIWFNMPDLNM